MAAAYTTQVFHPMSYIASASNTDRAEAIRSTLYNERAKRIKQTMKTVQSEGRVYSGVYNLQLFCPLVNLERGRRG